MLIKTKVSFNSEYHSIKFMNYALHSTKVSMSRTVANSHTQGESDWLRPLRLIIFHAPMQSQKWSWVADGNTWHAQCARRWSGDTHLDDIKFFPYVLQLQQPSHKSAKAFDNRSAQNELTEREVRRWQSLGLSGKKYNNKSNGDNIGAKVSEDSCALPNNISLFTKRWNWWHVQELLIFKKVKGN